MLNAIEVFGEAVWHGNTNAPARAQDAALGQQTFIRGMLETPTEEDHRNPLDLVASLLLHILIVGVVVLIPLFFTHTIDLGQFEQTFLVAPRPPAAPPPPAQAVKAVKAVPRPIPQQAITQPVAIPAKIRVVHDEPPPPDAGALGVEGGVPGGVPGGVLGGIIGGTGNIAPPPPSAAHPTHEILRVGGDVKEPQVIYAPQPAYPILAQTGKIQGTVVIDAVIDENGRVVQERAISGPALLMRAALNAVSQWRYQPTILDGQAVSIRMHVTVKFRLE
jgi:periplasmic protein TonB